MGKPHNWEETDNLLEKLRAKINEDTSEPAPPAPEPEAAGKTPDRTPEPNANIPLAGRKRRKNRTRVQPPETDGTGGDGAKNAEKEQEAVTAQKPAPAPAAPISKLESPAPESAAPTTQSAPPAPSQPAPVADKPAGEPTAADAVANLTVESLVKDIFGAAKAVGDAPPATAEPEKEPADGEEEETPVSAAPEPPLAENAAPAERTEAGKEEASAVAEVPATATDRKNGQMAFVLPETGHLRSENDLPEEEKQDLFAAFSIDDSGTGKVTTRQAPREEHNALKESVESSEEDLKLLLDLDYEEELGNAIGFDKIREYRELGVNGAPLQARRSKRKVTDKREYESRGQEGAIRKEYIRQKKGHILRFAFTVVLLLLIFLYEHPAWLPLIFKGPLDGAAFPRSYILFGLQLLLLDAALCYRRLREGIVSFFRFSPIDYSLCSVAVLVTALYHVILLFLPFDGAPVLYLSPAAAGLVLMSLSDLFDWYREFNAFRVVSSRRQKYALISRVSVGGKQNSAKERLLENEQDENLLYARPVGFVRNYFANTDRRVEHNRTLGTRLFLVLAVGLACGLYTVAAGKSGTVFQVVLITFFLCLPCISLLVTSLPMFLGTILRLGRSGAIIGEEPVYGCGEQTTLVMPDTEIFEKMDHEQFELVEHCDIQRTLILVHALLEKIQSPLAASVEVDEELRVPPEKVELLEIENDGIAANIGEEKTPLMLGSVTYLQRHGIQVQPRKGTANGDLRKMLLATVDGRVSAIFLARYRFAQNVKEFLEDLAEEDVRLMVRTKDPGVRNDLFHTLQPDTKDPVQVMKPTAAEMDIRTDRVDATIVALDSCMAAGETFLICRRIRRAGLFGRRLQVISMLVGAGLAMLLSFFGKLQVFTPTLLTVYIFFWSALDAVASYLYLRDKENV